MFEQQGGNPGSAQSTATSAPEDISSGLDAVQLAQAAPAGEPIGAIEELLGDVTVTRADGSAAAAAPGAPVYLDDVVTTGNGSSVEIQFVDGTRFSLGQDGQMTLDTLVYDPNGSSNELDLSVAQGAFTFVTGAIAGAPGEGMEVRVPVGTIGIRGTAVGGGPDTATADTTDYTIVLLPEPGGVGRIVLTDLFGRSVVLDDALEAMDISSLGLAPGEPVQLTREQVIALLGLSVENIEDILNEIQNFEPEDSPEDDVNPEAGPQQEGQLLDTTPNTGGIRTLAGETLTLGQITSLFTIGDEQGFGRPLGGFVPNGGLGNEGDEGGFNGVPQGSDGPIDTLDPIIDDDDDDETPEPPEFLFLTGDDGDNVLDASGFELPTNITGNGGNDVLIGSDFNDILNGGAGNDTLDAGAGDDQVNGGAGDDLLIGGSGQGNDALDGGDGTDTVQYSSATQSITVNLNTGVAFGDPAIGNDTLDNIENVVGGQGSDSITGNGADNVLEGGNGNDTLTGLGGDDTISGGAGSDVAVFTGNFEDYTIEGAEGGGFFITDNREGAENDGTDFVAGDVEVIRFDDGDFATSPNAVNDVDTVSADDQVERTATNGSAMRTTVEVNAGAVLTLRFNFLDSEPDLDEGSFKDFAAIIIGDQVIKLADVDQSELKFGVAGTQFDEQTGYWTFSFTFTEGGEYTLGLAVMNEDDTLFNAGLLVDNLSISGGGFSDGFENGLDEETWETIGNVSTTGAYGNVGTAVPPQGAQQALLLTQNGALASDIEEFLGLGDGQLSDFISRPSVSGNVLDNDGVGSANVAVASVVYDGDPEDVSVATSENIVTFTAQDGSWELRFDLTTGSYVFTVLGPLDYAGQDSLSFDFRYVVDGVNGSDDAVLTIVVEEGLPSTGGNEAPTNLVDVDGDANTITVDANNGAAVQITARATDPDDGDSLTYSLTDSANGLFEIDSETGVVTLVEGGTLSGLADSEISITVRATDEGGLFTEEDFTVVVTDDNQDPVAVDDASEEFVTDNLTNLPIHSDLLLANDSDPDDDGLFISNVFGAVGGAVAFGQEGLIIFTPQAGYTGPASFQYTVSDGEGGEDTATVSLLITAPDGPTEGDDILFGTPGVDSINGLGGNDTIFGLADNDTLRGGPGDDQLFGAEGSDVLLGGAGTDEIDGGSDEDIVLYSNSPAGIVVNLATGEVSNDGFGTTDILTNVEQVSGSGFNDVIDGSDVGNFLDGGSGDDTLNGAGGQDLLQGAAGNDTLNGGAERDILNGDDGNDTMNGEGGDDSLVGGAGNDIMNGGDDDDVLFGTLGEDTFNGGGGDDILTFDTFDPQGAGIVDGGAGNDTLIFQVAGATIDLSTLSVAGVETINIFGLGVANNTLALSAADVLNMSDDEGGSLTVQGNAGDALAFHDAANWSVVTINTGSQSFNIFTNGPATVTADAAISHNIISPDA